MLSCGKVALPYYIERYEKGGKSKIERICEMVSMLPISKGVVYGLSDSWYINKKVIEAHFERGYHLIGALKTNRIIYLLGLNTYQVRSTKSIDRLLWLISLTYLYCTVSDDEYCKFGQGIKNGTQRSIKAACSMVIIKYLLMKF
jgi:hypothetical protein